MLTIDFEGFQDVIDTFKEMSAVLNSRIFPNCLKDAAQSVFMDNKNNNFDDSSCHGTPWKPLSEITLRWKRRKWEQAQMKGKFSPQPLVVTGKLKNQWRIYNPFRTAVVMDTNTIYAPLQQYGGKVTMGPHKVKSHKYKRKNGTEVKVKEYTVNKPISHVIPPRPFLPDTEEDYREYLDELEGLLQDNGLPCEIKLKGYSK